MIRFILLIFVITTNSHAQDSLESAIITSASAMRAQGERLKVIAQNIANADSTGFDPGSDPYSRKIIHFHNKIDKKTGANIIVPQVTNDKQTAFKTVYNPTHPAANSEGYVMYPNVDAIIENADSREAMRSYEANLSVIEISRSMMNRNLELLR